MSDIQLSSIILEQGIDAYMEFCKQNPDALPIAVERYENAMSYAVGFWWLSLDDRTKTAQLEKHPVFAEKYTYKTCETYGGVCKKIPTPIRLGVVQNLSMKVTQKLVNSTSDPTELEFWFNLALNFPQLSARNLEMLIEAKKETPEIMPYVVGELPKQVAGKLNDKTKKERLQKLLQSAKEQYKPVTVIEEKIVEKEVIKEIEKPLPDNAVLLKKDQKIISKADFEALQKKAETSEHFEEMAEFYKGHYQGNEDEKKRKATEVMKIVNNFNQSGQGIEWTDLLEYFQDEKDLSKDELLEKLGTIFQAISLATNEPKRNLQPVIDKEVDKRISYLAPYIKRVSDGAKEYVKLACSEDQEWEEIKANSDFLIENIRQVFSYHFKLFIDLLEKKSKIYKLDMGADISLLSANLNEFLETNYPIKENK